MIAFFILYWHARAVMPDCGRTWVGLWSCTSPVSEQTRVSAHQFQNEDNEGPDMIRRFVRPSDFSKEDLERKQHAYNQLVGGGLMAYRETCIKRTLQGRFTSKSSAETPLTLFIDVVLKLSTEIIPG